MSRAGMPRTASRTPARAGTARSTRRLHIDWTACDGRGLCTELLPELLDTDPWGFPLARDGTKEPAVPPGLEEHARRAVEACPLLALRLVDRPGRAA